VHALRARHSHASGGCRVSLIQVRSTFALFCFSLPPLKLTEATRDSRWSDKSFWIWDCSVGTLARVVCGPPAAYIRSAWLVAMLRIVGRSSVSQTVTNVTPTVTLVTLCDSSYRFKARALNLSHFVTECDASSRSVTGCDSSYECEQGVRACHSQSHLVIVFVTECD
jgi:hypothetical protein